MIVNNTEITSTEFLALICLCMSRNELMRNGATEEEVTGDMMLEVMEVTLTNFYDIVRENPKFLDNDTIKTIVQISERSKSLMKHGE